jgi:adenosylmethionine-8-amino-7-oxononanoate aminotransferase
MEAALKLAMEYFVWQGQPERTNFIARHESYHGTTLGSLSVSGRRSPFRHSQNQPQTTIYPTASPSQKHQDD